MPTIRTARRLAGTLALAAAVFGAGAVSANELLVSQHPGDERTVRVEISDLDLASGYDRDTLTIRIERAARQVCDVNLASKLDKGPTGQICMSQARSGAREQLAALGLAEPARLAAR